MSFALVRALRPHQWIKSLLVFAGPVFALRLLEPESLLRASVTFFLFCAASSSVYLFNDLRDREADRHHPQKRRRPIAAGELSAGMAAICSGLLFVVAMGGAILLGPSDLAVVFAAYFLLQIAYTLGLRSIPILDAILVSVGFVLRAVSGAVAIRVTISAWLLICTIFFALFVSLAKRRHELTQLQGTSSVHRVSLSGYDIPFLDQLIAIAAAASLMSYALYTTAPTTAERFHTHLLPLTIPFVIYSFFRLLYLMHVNAELGDPTLALIRDRSMLLSTGLWAASVLMILYMH